MAPVPAARPPWQGSDTPEGLVNMFWQAPEIALAVPAAAGRERMKEGTREEFAQPPGSMATTARSSHLDVLLAKSAWQQLGHMVAEQREQFLDSLLASRPGLAGLPFRKGKECRLNGSAARVLSRSSPEVRRLLAVSLTRGRRSVSDPEFPEYPASITQAVYKQLAGRAYPDGDPALPALEQVLTGEAAPVRLALVQYLRSPSDADATAVLARRAVFDPSAEAREAAVAALRSRPPAEYVPTLLTGLHYPWPPANYHAAEALTALRADAAVPDLVRALDAPDPASPFETEEGGKRGWAVRELVRINHHGSCLLCHAPSFDQKDLVRAPVPSPLEPLPPLSYYGPRRTSPSQLFVRADVTYLRQDFSEVMPVADPGPWPSLQRFDFLVRVRPLTEGEVQAWREREQLAGPQPLPAARQAAVYALRQLTGLDGGYTAESWRKALARAGRPVHGPPGAPR